MGGVFRDTEGQWFAWRSSFSRYTQARLVYETNPKGDATINNLELTALLFHIQLFTPNMQPLSHTCTAVDNKSAQGWYTRGSVISSTAVRHILWDLALLTRSRQIYASVGWIKGTNNTVADYTSRLTHLHDQMFLLHFDLTFSQKKSWQLLPLPYECRRRLASMLHIKCCHVDFQPPSTRSNPPPGTNGANYTDECTSQRTSTVSGTPFHSSISFLVVCVPVFWQPAES